LSGKADATPNNRLQPTLASDILIHVDGFFNLAHRALASGG
jgi:hypothetical protein